VPTEICNGSVRSFMSILVTLRSRHMTYSVSAVALCEIKLGGAVKLALTWLRFSIDLMNYEN